MRARRRESDSRLLNFDNNFIFYFSDIFTFYEIFSVLNTISQKVISDIVERITLLESLLRIGNYFFIKQESL